MRRLLNGYVRITDVLVNIGGVTASILILLTAGMVFYEIASRSLFNAPTEWSSELSVYAMIASAYLGAAYTLKEDGHIKVDFLLQRLNDNTQKNLKILTSFLGMIFSIILFYTGLGMVIRTYSVGITSASVLRIPMYIPQSLIPIGGLLLTLTFIRIIIVSLYPDIIKSKEQGGIR